MKDFILALAFVIGANALLAYAVYGALNTPVVQFSNQTGECVKVLPHGNCKELPKKYVKEWVR